MLEKNEYIGWNTFFYLKKKYQQQAERYQHR